MLDITEEFPHHGEHLANDEKQAEMTIELLALFVVALAIVFIFALLG